MKKISILFVPSCSQRAPGPRYRVYQYLPLLKKENIPFKVFPVLSEKTTEQMIRSPEFNKIRKIVYYFQVFLEKTIRAWRVILLASKFDILFLQRTTFSFGLEKLLYRINQNIIFDLDDAIFIPDTEQKGLVYWFKERLMSKEVAAILGVSKYAIVENKYIEKYTQQFCKNSVTITGPIDTKRNTVRAKSAANEKVTIGWIGSPSTMPYLRMLDEVFKMVAQKYKRVEFKVIGASKYSLEGVKLVFKLWHYETEVEELQGCDIGIMPMPDDRWSRGKIGVKMLQYMAVGIPVVVSYTPTNLEIIDDRANGFIAYSQGDWVKILSMLIEDPELRRRVGMNGRKTVEEKCSLEVNFGKFLEVIEKVAQNSLKGRPAKNFNRCNDN